MHGAKEGDRERVREREGNKRERDGEWERSTQFGEGSINGPSNRGRVVLTLKFDFLTFNDLCGHTYINDLFAY